MAPRTYSRPSPDELRTRLTPLEFQVSQLDATEPPFRNAFWDNHADGLYVDVASGEPLFSSRDKFESGTGWPSFTSPVEPARVVTHEDVQHGMRRTEVRSRDGDSHLGHVFPDGPQPGGLRYCINSASLKFVAVADLERAGYGDYRALFDGTAAPQGTMTDNVCAVPAPGGAPGPAPGCEATLETAIVAGGCFWGMEDLLRKIDGVLDTEVGYTGGSLPNPTYQDVKTGRTGHAESVRIVFDPTRVSFATLLETWFFKMHDPTTVNQQGNDRGSQYRSAIFATTPAQQRVAEEVIARVDASGAWKNPIATQVLEATAFTSAEDYHQDYLEKNPGGYTCHWMRT